MEKSKVLKNSIKINTSPKVTISSRNEEWEEDDGETKEKPKESYSSFLIRMLVGKKRKNNNIKIGPKIANTIYKSNLPKKKINYNPFNTNYIPNIKKVSTSTDKNQSQKINQINKKYSIQINTLKNMISYTDRDNPKQNNEKMPMKIIKTFNSTEYNNDNKMKKKYKSFDLSSNINSNEKLIQTIKKIMEENKKNLSKSKQLKSLKNKKMIRSVNNLNKMRLNALYGYDKNFLDSKKSLLKKKELIGLGNYQNDLLKVAQRNLCKDHMFKLFTELQSIKKNADMVKPLPPINYPALIIHSFKEVDDKKTHKTKIALENKKYKDMDDYEKELYNIRKSNAFKRVKIERNKRMYKIYEILPEHVVETLYKNKNKIIK